MKTFRQWLYSENSGKNLLLLIHPDCVFELGVEACIGYTNKINSHVQRFDYVISHLFWPEAMINYMKSKRSLEESRVLDKIIETVKLASDVVTPQRGPDDCTYNRELPEYLMENDGVNVFMAGGYEDNCLWRAYVDMFKKLDWLLREKNIVVQWYEPLIFGAKDSKVQSLPDDEVQFDRANLKSVDARPATFDRRKVDYGEPK